MLLAYLVAIRSKRGDAITEEYKEGDFLYILSDGVCTVEKKV